MKKKRKWKRRLGIGFLLILISLWIDARWVEPHQLIVQKLEMTSQWIEEPISIIQLTDIHLGKYYKTKHLNKVIDKINDLEPDLIILSGDLIDDNRTFNEMDETIKVLSRLKATYGKYAVFGNHDYAYEGDSRYRMIMQKSGFTLLVNQAEKVTFDNGNRINIIGLDDCIGGKANIELAFQGVHEKAYNVLVAHEPDIAEEAVKYPVHLQLSGHSHGGQVRIPFIGALYTPRYSKIYTKGMYNFKGQSPMMLYVSSGIGTTLLPYRFLNLPEIVQIKLIPLKNTK